MQLGFYRLLNANCIHKGATFGAVQVDNMDGVDGVDARSKDSESFESANGLFVTSDGGDTWEMLSLAGFGDASPYLVETHPLDCNMIFVATWDGMLLVSSDGGASWSEIDIPLASVAGMKTVEPNGNLESQLIIYGAGGIVGLPLTT